jgi:shikimate dehydrogenase
MPVPPEILLRPPAVVVDLVYHPVDTPLLIAAREHGARTVDGVGMLVHQGALAFRLWTGVDPSIEAMSTAARRALSAR